MRLPFKTTETLYSLKHIPPHLGMPPGLLLKMPMGEKVVTAEMYVIEKGLQGAYRLRVSKCLPVDEWETMALRVLGDLVSFVVTDRDAVPEAAIECIVTEFHLVWTSGAVDPAVAAFRDVYRPELDDSLMRWVRAPRVIPSDRNTITDARSEAKKSNTEGE